MAFTANWFKSLCALEERWQNAGHILPGGHASAKQLPFIWMGMITFYKFISSSIYSGHHWTNIPSCFAASWILQSVLSKLLHSLKYPQVSKWVSLVLLENNKCEMPSECKYHKWLWGYDWAFYHQTLSGIWRGGKTISDIYLEKGK